MMTDRLIGRWIDRYGHRNTYDAYHFSVARDWLICVLT
jgi:hypothetical protein